jgi:hypothetical protein
MIMQAMLAEHRARGFTLIAARRVPLIFTCEMW